MEILTSFVLSVMEDLLGDDDLLGDNGGDEEPLLKEAWESLVPPRIDFITDELYMINKRSRDFGSLVSGHFKRWVLVDLNT